jgi:hypothetical protein
MVFPVDGDTVAERVADALVHVIAPLTLQLTTGFDTFDCKVVLEEAVQPLPD